MSPSPQCRAMPLSGVPGYYSHLPLATCYVNVWQIGVPLARPGGSCKIRVVVLFIGSYVILGHFVPLPLITDKISAKVATMVEKKLAESHASLERRFELLAKQLLEHGQHTPGEVGDIQRPHGVATVGWFSSGRPLHHLWPSGVTSTPERCGGCCGAGRMWQDIT